VCLRRLLRLEFFYTFSMLSRLLIAPIVFFCDHLLTSERRQLSSTPTVEGGYSQRECDRLEGALQQFATGAD